MTPSLAGARGPAGPRPPEPPPGPWADRLHQALMPDYNRAATVFWWSVVALGVAALAFALAKVAGLPPSSWWQIAAGTAITMVAGLFPVRIPRSTNAFTAGEIFIFLLLLMHGPAAATLAASADAAVGSWRTSRRWTSRIASPAMNAVAMMATGSLLQAVLDAMQRQHVSSPGALIVAVIVFALAYFVCNALLMSALPLLKRGERIHAADLLGVFGWIGNAYAGSAAVAAPLFLIYRDSGLGVLAAVVPLIAMMLATLHYYFKQQQADAAMRLAAAQAAEREATLAARHLVELHHIAFHDSLTGLPNRRSFLAQLAEAVVRNLAAPQPQGFAVMFLDFDRFKLINDSLGHATGDAFLVQASRRLQGLMGEQDTLARLGGDEFAVLMRGISGLSDATALADRLLAAASQPFQLAGAKLSSSASIGITTSALPYTAPEEVLRDADIAMYRAKAAGKARHVVFDAALHTQLSQRLKLESDLRAAVAADQIGLAYQPIFELASGRVAGFEALARWSHPELGPIAPNTFIAMALELGLITDLTDRLALRACQQMRQWQLALPGAQALMLQVNISGRDIVHPGLAERMGRSLHSSGLAARQLRLELNESSLMQHVAGAAPTLAALQQAGIGLCLDDFGSGFSSLRHLNSLPIDSLKIDPSFVGALQSGSSTGTDQAVVRAIVELGHSLGKAVVAEGIETAEQLAVLRALGCHHGQGYHLAPPMAPEAVPALLAHTGIADAPGLSDDGVGAPPPDSFRH